MRSRRWAFVSSLVCSVILITSAAAAQDVRSATSPLARATAIATDPDRPPTSGESAPDAEMVSGTFECSGFIGPAYGPAGATLSFAGTAGIVATTIEVGGATVDSPGEFCDALRAKTLAKAVSLGCVTGQVRTRVDAYMVDLTFKFVCDGKRGDVVSAIAALSKKFLTDCP